MTQPEWPSRVPRRTSCSDIVMGVCGREGVVRIVNWQCLAIEESSKSEFQVRRARSQHMRVRQTLVSASGLRTHARVGCDTFLHLRPTSHYLFLGFALAHNRRRITVDCSVVRAVAIGSQQSLIRINGISRVRPDLVPFAD